MGTVRTVRPLLARYGAGVLAAGRDGRSAGLGVRRIGDWCWLEGVMDEAAHSRTICSKRYEDCPDATLDPHICGLTSQF